MQGHDIYIRLTDPSGRNKPVVNAHRVWDSARFAEAQQKQYSSPKLAAGDQRTVAVVSHADYLKSKG